MDRIRERAIGSGRVRDCGVCVRVGARLSAWKVMDGGGGWGYRGDGGVERVAKV